MSVTSSKPDLQRHGWVLNSPNVIGSILTFVALFWSGLVLGAPTIPSQPQPETVMEGGSVVFKVTAASSNALSYQWRFNSSNLGGNTNANLELPNVNTNQSGEYTVVVGDSSGSITSQIALLSVNIRTPCFGGVAFIPSPPGYSLAALPLAPFDVGYTVSTLFDGVSNGTSIYKLDGNGFQVNNYLFGWSDPGMNLVPGEGWFLRNPTPTNQNLIVIGNAQIGRLTNRLATGFSICGSAVPFAGGLSSSLQFTPPAGTKAYLFDNAAAGYQIFQMGAGGWIPSEPNITNGQGLWILTGGGIVWTQAVDCDIGSGPTLTPYRIVQPQIASQTAELNFFTYHTNSSMGRIYDSDGLTPLSNDFYGQLYAGTNAAEPSLQPIGVPVPFLSGSGAGYIRSGSVKVVGRGGAEVLHVQLRVWDSSRGPTYEVALTNKSRLGKSAIFHVITQAPLIAGSPGLPPPDVNGFPSFSVQPVPTFVITRIRVSGSDVVLEFNSDSGRNYRAERTIAVVSPVTWETVSGAALIPGTGGIVQVIDAGAAGQKQRFYRIVRLP